MKPTTLTIARYIGIAGAVLVPALVVAQQIPALPTFTRDTLLTANSLQTMSTELGRAIARINTLEAQIANLQNGEQGITGDSLYPSSEQSPPVAPGARVDIDSGCADTNDVIFDCSCSAGTGDSRGMDLRVVDARATECFCSAENVGDENSTLVATATCLRVP